MFRRALEGLLSVIEETLAFVNAYAEQAAPLDRCSVCAPVCVCYCISV
jgi:hypothetical protein